MLIALLRHCVYSVSLGSLFKGKINEREKEKVRRKNIDDVSRLNAVCSLLLHCVLTLRLSIVTQAGPWR